MRKRYVHGATDEFCFKAVEKPVHPDALHATIFKLLGFDHEQCTSNYAGLDLCRARLDGASIVDD